MSVAAAGLVTAEVVWPLHVDAPRAYLAFEIVIMLSALIGAGLLAARFRYSRRLQDLLLLVALSAVALKDLASTGVLAFSSGEAGTAGTGGRLTCTLLVMGALLASAYMSTGRLAVSIRGAVWIAAGASFLVLALGALIDRLAPGASDASPAYEPLVIALACASFCGLLVAGFGLASRAGAEVGERRLLAAASFLLAAASLQQLVLPLSPNDWVTPGQLLRVASYGLLFASAVRLYIHTREQQARASVSAERIRIARDLHDGLAQDLAFIAAHGETLMRELGEFHPLVVAARRALAASRGAIVDLEASDASSTAAALRQVAAELEARFGVKITVRTETAEDPDVRMSDRSELVRIAREAIVNAVHHGGAQNVEVTLGSRHSDLLLRIRDDGLGLDNVAAQVHPGTGLGMGTMRARAQALDGRLVARGRPDGGTEISVVAASPEKRRRRTRPGGQASTAQLGKSRR